MKTFLCLFAAMALVARADEKVTFPPLEQTLTDATLFTKPMEDVQTTYRHELSPAQQEMRNKIRARMKEKGLDLPDAYPGAFQWLSSAKDGLRADPKLVDLFGEKVGEVIIRAGTPGKVGPISVSLYNRGDDGDLSPKELSDRMEAWKARLSTHLGSQPEARDQRGTVNLTGWMWKKGRTAWLLESSVSKSPEGPRAEFARIRIASMDAANTGGQIARRSGLTDHVVHKDNGDVYLEGVPMVDQGQKGYCAVATTERVVRYYGLDVDQHEMAEIANTGSMGTSMGEMEEALKNATGKLHVKTTKHFDLDLRQFEQDVRTYNQLAKKQGEKEFLYERKVTIVNPLQFWSEVKPDLFLQMKTAQSGFSRFTNKIDEYINQGIPLCWALQLGMFKETGIPQTRGGHMRLIIGYNQKTNEIIYTDSWGKGHEFKRMPAGQAWCMTMALYTMAPTK
ncbi:MAG: C39 family peptidase [Luteolibacter sp.]